ncbi:ribbon-helix-helix protein, CopG family [Nocardia sp. NPDC052566]|uniref:ribbon-helix-helix protein, CopG family n=1 Tax=Nocardia sp. NPDC052566 TaxID=3364330 RepID=UPI0037C77C48
MTDKPVTVRLPQDMIQRLEALMIVDGTNLAEQIRRAMNLYVEQRLADPELQAQVAAAHARTTDVLATLTAPATEERD